MSDEPGRILAIDIGDKRIGLAISDPTRTIAQPLATLTRRIGKRFPMKQLHEYLTEYEPAVVVVGLPLTEDGDVGDRALEARAVGDMIAEKAGLPVSYVDERMTTRRALRAVQDLGGSTRGRKQDVDPLAATVILQQFLEHSA